ncbi:hypothetical protein NECAME_02827, partial [Necator americanus]
MHPEVSGHLISKFVDVMKVKFGSGNDNSSRSGRECSIYNPFNACYFCPKDGSYIYPRQFCQAFVWKSPPSSSLERNDVRFPAAFVARRGMSAINRLRRSRYAFLQRKSPAYLHPPLLVPLQPESSIDTSKTQESSSEKAASPVTIP